MKKTYKPTLLIDLDGVLNKYDGKFDENFIPPIKEGAEDFLRSVYQNYSLVLFTTRQKNLALQWLKDNYLNKYFTDVTDKKIPAYLIVDDRSLRFTGNYDVLLNDIKNFVVWYKNKHLS